MFENINKENLDDLVSYVNDNFDEYVLKLPIKPNTMIYIVNEVRHLFEKVDTSLIPKDCTNYYTEVCCDCPFLEKECKKVGLPQNVWFHLDSPYITYIQNYWNASVFDNLDDCFNACVEKYGTDLVNKLIEDISNEGKINEQEK